MNETIFEVLISLLGQRYKVIKSFDAEADLDLNGVFAVNLSQVQPLLHGEFTDYRYGVTVNAQTLTEEDKDRSRINEMFEYCNASVTAEDIKKAISSCAGVLKGNASINSDGETNNFSLQFDIFICS